MSDEQEGIVRAVVAKVLETREADEQNLPRDEYHCKRIWRIVRALEETLEKCGFDYTKMPRLSIPLALMMATRHAEAIHGDTMFDATVQEYPQILDI